MHECRILEKVQEAAQLYLQGKTQKQIAVEMGCSAPTVNRYIMRARAQWLATANEATERLVAREMARLEVLYRDLWVQWERSKADKETRTRKRTKDGVERTVKREGQSGDAALAARLIEIHRRLCELRGLDAPRRTEVSGPGGGPVRLKAEQMSDDELAAIATRSAGAIAGGGGDGIIEASACSPLPDGIHDVYEAGLPAELPPSAIGGEVGPGVGG